MNQHIANRLVELRKHAGYSQEEVADLIGVSRQAVSKWERGESSPDTDNLIELARLYRISLDELVNGESLPEIEQTPSEKKQGGTVWRDDGMVVEIKEGEISVENEDGEKKIYDREEVNRKRLKEKRINTVVSSAFALLTVIAYLVLGFTLKNGKGWSCGWTLFLLIPIVSSVIEMIFYKRLALFAFPVLIVGIYCTLGMILGLWHPTWVMFISIPIYYIVAEKVDRLTRARDYGAIKDALEDKKERR